jgi:hypothetical protein
MVGFSLLLTASTALAFSDFCYYDSEKDCIAWRCNDGEVDPGTGVCDNYVNRTHYLTPCEASNTYCDTYDTIDSSSENETGTGTCVASTKTSITSYPGEFCDSVTYFCKKNGGCTESTCQGEAENGVCSQDYDCAVGLYCNSKVCAKRLEIDSVCTEDTQCVKNARCLEALDGTKKCVKLFSLEPGTELSESGCSANPGLKFALNWFCSSGYCGLNSERKSFCTEPIRSQYQKSEDHVCVSSKDSCDSIQDPHIGFSIKGHCKCGFNKNGNAYCTSFLGDDHVKSYYTHTVNFYQNQVLNCNRPLAKDYQFDDLNQCLLKTNGTQAAKEYNLSKRQYLNKPDYISNDDCVKESVNTDYWELYEDVNEDDDDSAKMLIGLAAVSIMLLF